MLRLEKFVTDSKSFIEEEGKEGERGSGRAIEGEREREREREREEGGRDGRGRAGEYGSVSSHPPKRLRNLCMSLENSFLFEYKQASFPKELILGFLSCIALELDG